MKPAFRDRPDRWAEAPFALLTQITALWGFAVAQPLLAVVRANLGGEAPDVLIDQGRWTVLAVAVGLTLLPPLALAALVPAVARRDPAAGRRLMGAIVAVLSAVIALAFLAEAGGAIRSWMAPIGLLIGIAVAAVWLRFPPLAMCFSLLGAAPIAYLLFFLVSGPVGALMRADPPDPSPPSDGLRAPVVVVLLDELPLSTLLDAGGGIDAQRFPGFAAFAQTATWYRRATTVHDFSRDAIPAVATGSPVRDSASPYWFQHPDNLLTLLARHGPVRAIEAQEDLCPDRVCAEDRTTRPAGGVLRLVEDAVDGRLRELSNGRFGRRTLVDEAARLDAFIAAQRRGPHGLEYVHTLLPHEPWTRAASGRSYTPAARPVPGLDGDVWAIDSGLTDTARRRHVAQAQFVDGEIARLFTRLRELGTFDASLIVVLADHGASFEPGGPRRAASSSNLGEIASVPLLVKLPGQRRGDVSDRAARSIDVLPTVLDVLDIPAPASVAGRSLVQPPGGDTRTVVYHTDPSVAPVTAPLAVVAAATRRTARDALARDALIAGDPLVGRATPTKATPGGAAGVHGLTVGLAPDAVLVEGTVPEASATRPVTLALAVDGRVVQVAEQRSPTLSMFADGLAGEREHEIALFTVRGAGDERTLVLLRPDG